MRCWNCNKEAVAICKTCGKACCETHSYETGYLKKLICPECMEREKK